MKNKAYSTVEYNKKDYNELVQKLNLSQKNLNDVYKPHNVKKLNTKQVFNILSVVTTETGYDKTICELYNINSKLIYRLKNKLIYKDDIVLYDNLSNEEKADIKIAFMEENKLSQLKRKGREEECAIH